MPIIRLTKLDPDVAVTDGLTDMSLVSKGYDGSVFNFDWTGRTGLLPLSAVQEAINSGSRRMDVRQIIIFTDKDKDSQWSNNDGVNVLSSRLSPRLQPQVTVLSNAPMLLGIFSPSDRISFTIGVKPKVYAIEIVINPVSDGEYGFPEIRT